MYHSPQSATDLSPTLQHNMDLEAAQQNYFEVQSYSSPTFAWPRSLAVPTFGAGRLASQAQEGYECCFG